MSRHNFVLQRQTLYDRQLSAMPMHGAAWPTVHGLELAQATGVDANAEPKDLVNLSVELVTWVVT